MSFRIVTTTSSDASAPQSSSSQRRSAFSTNTINTAQLGSFRAHLAPPTAAPLKTLDADAAPSVAVDVAVAENEISTLVVGLPLRADGTRGAAAMRVEKFIGNLQSQLSIPVVTCNEFLSSREADEILRANGADFKTRRARSDEYAATVILRDYLDAQAVSSGSDSSAGFPQD